MSAPGVRVELARAVAAAVPDPELPMLTIEDLGVLRDVRAAADGGITVEVTPTYSGCPAFEAIKAELTRRLRLAGFESASVRTVLSPAWSSDWISERGRRALERAGIAPPGVASAAAAPVLLSLESPPPPAACPRCRSAGTLELSRFGATACRSLWRCGACGEPFERFKEH